jgi:hypothetical protein
VTDAVLRALCWVDLLHAVPLACGPEGERVSRTAEVVNLDLGDTLVTDLGLKELIALPRLSELSLYGTAVTDEGLRALTALPGLTALDLSRTQVTDAGVRALTALPHLAALDLGDTAVTDASAWALTAVPTLTALNLEGTRVAAAGLGVLGAIPTLKTLTLGCTQVTDEVLRVFRRCGMLQILARARGPEGQRPGHPGEVVSLNLSDTPVTDAGLEDLLALPNLKEVSLYRTQVTAPGVAKLGELLPGCRISR